MARSSGYQGTNPTALSAQKDTGSPAVAADRTNFELVGVIGTMLSDSLGTMQSVVDEVAASGAVTRAQIARLQQALDSARGVAMQSQQIARLGGGRLRQSHEKLKLDELLRDALLERNKLFRQRGVELYHGLKQVEVIVDAGLLVCLIDAALEWALDMGRKLVITLEMKNWPEHGMLLIRSSDKILPGKPGSEPPEDSGNTLAWYLVVEAANAMGVPYTLVTGIASPRDAFLAVTRWEEGVEHVAYGFMIRDGEIADLVSGTRHVERCPVNGWVTSMTIAAKDERGRTLEAQATRLSGIIINRHSFIDSNALMRWTINGHAGCGEDQDMWPVHDWAAMRRSARA